MLADPRLVLTHPALEQVCQSVATEAEALFEKAAAIAAKAGRHGLWTATAMMILYRRLLNRMRRRGWSDRPLPRMRLGKRERVWVTLRCLSGFPPRS